MILSSADLIARLNHPRNSAARSKQVRGERTVEELDRNDRPIGENTYLRNSTPGRREGDKNIPEDIKIPAMVLARLGVSDSEVAGTFGIGVDSVGRINRGAISEKGKSVAEQAINTIVGKVTERLDQTIDSLTPAKVMNSKAVEIAHIAKALSGIIGDLAPRDQGKNVNQVQVVIHGVSQRTIGHYEEVIVSS